MAERSKAAVLKTVYVRAYWGSNPYPSAKIKESSLYLVPFIFSKRWVRTQAWCSHVVFKTVRACGLQKIDKFLANRLCERILGFGLSPLNRNKSCSLLCAKTCHWQLFNAVAPILPPLVYNPNTHVRVVFY